MEVSANLYWCSKVGGMLGGAKHTHTHQLTGVGEHAILREDVVPTSRYICHLKRRVKVSPGSPDPEKSYRW